MLARVRQRSNDLWREHVHRTNYELFDHGVEAFTWYALEELARYDASIGWNTFTANSSTLIAPFLDADVNRTIPFYREMERLHAGARELPRLAEWSKIASVIDNLVLSAIGSHRPENE